MSLAVRMLIEVWRERSLWNPKVLLHVCHRKDCLGEPWCHQKHLGNSLTCLYNINLLHISIAGSCVIISSHVLSGRGPLTEQKAGVVCLILLSTEHRQSLSPKVCVLTASEAQAENVWAAECRLKHKGASLWQEDMTSETGCIWDTNGAEQSKVSQGLADITQPALWSFGAALQRETNLKALRRCSLFK